MGEAIEAGHEVSEATRAEEQREAEAAHVPDRPPTHSEAESADDRKAAPGVAEHERDMAKRGREVKGEGQID
jgi:hypothetical protein